jgi:hypothetical protein
LVPAHWRREREPEINPVECKEALMKRFLKVLPAAALLIVGTTMGRSFAEENEANDISWNLENNYNDSHQTVCVAENYHEYPVDAVFDVFPADFDPAGNPMPDRTVITMKPYVEYQVFRWASDYSGPGPRCDLLNYSVTVH